MNGRSLTGKTIRSTVLSSVALGLVALIIGLGFYGYTLVRHYITRAFDTAKLASVSAQKGADSVSLSKEIMGIYRGLTDEERKQVGTEEYRQHFSGLESVSKKGGAYDVLVHMLRNFVNDVDYVYLGMYDRDTQALVYIVDSDADEPLFPGEWESVTRQGLEKFLNWNGEGMLYDIDNTQNYGWMCTAGFPIRDEAGDICEFLLVDVSINSVIRNMLQFALQLGLGLALATALIARLASRRIRRSVVQPIDAIAGAAVTYVRDKRSGSACQDHFSALKIRTGDELEHLSRVMADMERDLADHEEQLTRITAEKERIGAELSLATQIQAAMLPHIFPPFPDRTDFDVYAVMDPAKEVGGDFYDYFLVDDDHLGLVIADVSGKGVPAALFMMASKIILQSVAMLGGSPGEILTKTNEAICSNNEAQMFVTVWVGILELSTGTLTCANAGHEYPVLKRKEGSFELYKDRHGFVIGGMEGIRYGEYRILLEPGDKLFVYTDGVPEAADPENRLFGTERMLSALNRCPDAAPEDVLKNMRQAVDAFVHDAEQFDDLTMLCLEYKGPRAKEGPMPDDQPQKQA